MKTHYKPDLMHCVEDNYSLSCGRFHVFIVLIIAGIVLYIILLIQRYCELPVDLVSKLFQSRCKSPLRLPPKFKG